MSKVNIVNFRKQSKADRHGWKVDFKIDKPGTKPVIYQIVAVEIFAKDKNGKPEELNYKFTEAWKYKTTGQIMIVF